MTTTVLKLYIVFAFDAKYYTVVFCNRQRKANHSFCCFWEWVFCNNSDVNKSL